MQKAAPTPCPSLGTPSNPTAPAPPRPPCQAFSNVLRRFLEAAGRGMWKADAETIQQLQQMYADMDSELEGMTK